MLATRQSRSGLDAAGFEINFTPRTRKPKRHSATARSREARGACQFLLYPGYAVPPYDNSLLAKIIIRAETWNVALARLRHALDQFEVKGIVTTVGPHKQLARLDDVQAARCDAGFLTA